MADEIEAIEPDAVEAVPALQAETTIEPVAEAPAVEDAEPAVADPPAPAAAPAREAPKWAFERINEETSKRQALEERLQQAVERATLAEELARRLQAKEAPEQPASAPRQPAQADHQTAVQQEAALQLFQRDLADVSNAGSSAYGAKWTDAINALNAYGANSFDIVGNVMEIAKDKTHEIMFNLAQDGERAVALARMSPARRIAEITRISDQMTKPAEAPKPAVAEAPKPAAVSRAPAPKPAIAPHAAAPDIDPKTPEGNDKMDDKQWEAWYKSTYMKRSA